jgi:hypothetical protein
MAQFLKHKVFDYKIGEHDKKVDHYGCQDRVAARTVTEEKIVSDDSVVMHIENSEARIIRTVYEDKDLSGSDGSQVYDEAFVRGLPAGDLDIAGGIIVNLDIRYRFGRVDIIADINVFLAGHGYMDIAEYGHEDRQDKEKVLFNKPHYHTDKEYSLKVIQCGHRFVKTTETY